VDQDSTPRSASIRRRTLGDRYDLERVIGVGGVAEVWRATDTRLGRRVAVKVLAGPAARDPGHRARIEREARALAAISHPNVVAVFDYAEDPVDEGEPIPYLVLELVEGPDLARYLAQRGPLDPDEAVTILNGILEGVRQAHAIGIIHGDLKPANVFLGPEGPKVGDFGVARILAEETGTTGIAATPTYAAPEVLTGSKPTPASDVYSAACVVYELVAGRPPFEGETFWDIASKHAGSEATPLTTLRDDIDPNVADVIAASLSTEPAQRPPDAAAFSAALQTAMTKPDQHDRDRAGDPPPTLPVVREPTEVLDRPSPGRRPDRWARLRSVPLGLVLAAAAVLVLAALQGQATATARVPSLVDMPGEEAQQVAEASGFGVRTVEADRGGVAGTVVGQEPNPATLHRRGTTITLTVTRGAPQIEVPDLTGLSADEARDALRAAGLSSGEISYQPATDTEPGSVLRTIPRAGTSMDEGSDVHIIAAAFPIEDDDDDDDDDKPGKPGPNRGRR